MTVEELRALLDTCPPQAVIEVQFDISDHDTSFELEPEVRTGRDGVVFLVAR